LTTHRGSAREPRKKTPPPERVEIFLPSTLGYEKVARSAAQAIAEEMGFSDDRIDDLKTAVSEACMNAIEHGNLESGSASVTVYMTAAKEQLEISIEDEGLQPMPEAIPTPGRSGGDNRGWGMFFISQMVDEMEINRLPSGGNQVKMVVYLTPPAADKA
jgi:serine/threonine-protein kinase RsbW